MKTLSAAFKELWDLFVDDYRHVIPVFVWIGLIAWWKRFVPDSAWQAPLLLSGIIVLLSISIIIAARDIRKEKTHRKSRNLEKNT